MRVNDSAERSRCAARDTAAGPPGAAMRHFDLSFPAPAENLALDEVLLDETEAGRLGNVLRFWESPRPFVVIGIAQAYRREVDVAACRAGGLGIYRRCSGGGCVLQGPGCLNYVLALNHAAYPGLETVRGSYCTLLGRLVEALRKRGVHARHNGISDLAVRGKKFSGNAQKRRRNAILHHGTLVYALDPELMERYLREPADRPKYRGERTHRGFVRPVPLDADALREAVCEAFGAATVPERAPRRLVEAAKELAQDKYADPGWNFRR